MCKDGEQQDFRNSSEAAPAAVEGSKVWGNVAYNVNGCQNGAWLPGNYAVGAGLGGIEVWKNQASEVRKTYSDQQAAQNWEDALDLRGDEWQSLSADPQEGEGPQAGGSLVATLLTVTFRHFMLAGTNFKVDTGNPKWAYVKAAMDAAGGQFHDRHGDYSKQVQGYLSKVAEAYEGKYDRSTKGGCPKCEEARRPAGAKDSLVGPPYSIVGRLAMASSFFKGHVNTQLLTAKNIYTSKWVKAWMDTKA
jgi:hypothetical protein